MLIFRPQNYKELFNLRHAQARNVVERIFGIAKRRFSLMEAAPEYSIEMQAMFIPAMGTVHNFIRIHDPQDDDFHPNHDNSPSGSRQEAAEPQVILPQELGMQITEAEKQRAEARRDRIAKKMWDDYQEYLLAV